MRVLVLGGTQFIGRTIVDLFSVRHDVTVLNRGTQPLRNMPVMQLRADRRDPVAMGAALTSKYDAIVDVSGTERIHMETLLAAGPAADVASYVFISSAAVYDRTKAAPPFRETDPAAGDSIWGAYGEAKAACEQLLQGAFGSRLTVLRPPYVYGPRNSEQREQFIWARLLARQPIFVPGDGETRIQFCHVGDLARIVLSAVEGSLPRAVYNVAEPRSYSFSEYIAILGRIAREPVHTVPVRQHAVPARDYFPFRQADLTPNVDRITALQPQRFWPLTAGLNETYQWFTDSGGVNYEPTSQEAAWCAQTRVARPRRHRV